MQKYKTFEFLRKHRNKESKFLLDKLQPKKKKKKKENETNILRCSECIEKNLENETTGVKFRAEDLHSTYRTYFWTNLLMFWSSISDGINIHGAAI